MRYLFVWIVALILQPGGASLNASEVVLRETGRGFIRCSVVFETTEFDPVIVRVGIPFAASVVVALEDAMTQEGLIQYKERASDTPVGAVTSSVIRYQHVAGFSVFPLVASPALTRYTTLNLKITFSAGDASGAQVVYDDAYEQHYEHLLINYAQARSFRQRPARTLLAKAALPISFSGSSYRVQVTTEGMYRLDYTYLRSQGIEWGTIDPRTIKMYNQRQQIPIRVIGEDDRSFDQDDAIIFYGEALSAADVRYPVQAPANTYYLTWGGDLGNRMSEDPVRIPWVELLTAPRQGSFNEELHFEEQNIFERQPELVGSDYYYWTTIGRKDRSFLYLDIPHPAETADSAYITIGLQGITYDANDSTKDHHFLFYLNGINLGDIWWDGRSSIDFVSRVFESRDISTDTLAELMILGPKDTPGREGVADQAYIDWIKVHYRREYRARDNQLAFNGDTRQGRGTRRYHIDGFLAKDIDLYDTAGRLLTGYTMAATDTSGDTVTYRMSYMDDADDPIRYLALDDAGYRLPYSLELNVATSAPFASQSGAAYVIIAHRQFATAAESLRVYRQREGLTSAVFYTDDIYHHFSDGIKTPYALRSFLQMALREWSIPPAYVVLLGDATYSSGPHPYDFIPTQLVRTPEWGMTASDNWFAALIGDDPVPDLMIGRLPVRSADEAMQQYRKIVAFEQEKPGLWHRNIALFAGGDETKWIDFNVFAEVSEELAYDPALRSRKVYTVNLPGLEAYAGGHDDAVMVINEGAPLVNFTGHGGGSVWADKNLMNLSNVDNLNNGNRLPLVFSLTCFTGFFDNPHGSSLGEAMLKSASGGAIGFIGASGYGWREGDEYFNKYLFNAIFSSGIRRTGAILNRAKYDMHQKYAAWDSRIVAQYTLLGDPAIQIALPQEEIILALPEAVVTSGETLAFTGTCSVLPGSVFVEIVSAAGQVVDNAVWYVATESFSYTSVVPATTPAGQGVIRCYAWNERSDAAGSQSYSVQEPLVVNRGIGATLPMHNDSVYVQVQVALHNLDPDSVMCRFKPYGENDWIAIRMMPVAVGSDLFRTVTGFVRPELSNPSRGREVKYRTTVYYDNSETENTGYSSYMIRARSDIAVYQHQVGLESRDGRVKLYAVLADSGESEAKNIVVQFFNGAPDTGIQLGLDAVLPLLGTTAPVRVAIVLPETLAGSIDVHVVINPDSLVPESNHDNNISRKHVEINLFHVSVESGSQGKRISPDGMAYCSIPDSAIDSNGIANFTALSADSLTIPAGQPDFFMATLGNDIHPVYSISLLDGSTVFKKPVMLGFLYDTSDTANNVALRENRLAVCQWDQMSERWQRLSDGIDTVRGLDTVLVHRPGVYALCVINDGQLPLLKVTVEGQSFTDGDYVSRTPALGVVITDRNGVVPDSILLFLNGDKISKNDYNRSVSALNHNMCLVSYRPQLDPGHYTFKVAAKDNALLRDETTITFSVADKFAIQFVANHPNPFWNQTVIAYRLTGMADCVTLKIYTSGGRLIRTLKDYNIIDYAEVNWDARDNEGRLVANGTYHLKITAEQGGKEVMKRAVMAFIRR